MGVIVRVGWGVRVGGRGVFVIVGETVAECPADEDLLIGVSDRIGRGDAVHGGQVHDQHVIGNRNIPHGLSRLNDMDDRAIFARCGCLDRDDDCES